jgi:hypothetical protein
MTTLAWGCSAPAANDDQPADNGGKSDTGSPIDQGFMLDSMGRTFAWKCPEWVHNCAYTITVSLDNPTMFNNSLATLVSYDSEYVYGIHLGTVNTDDADFADAYGATATGASQLDLTVYSEEFAGGYCSGPCVRTSYTGPYAFNKLSPWKGKGCVTPDTSHQFEVTYGPRATINITDSPSDAKYEKVPPDYSPGVPAQVPIHVRLEWSTGNLYGNGC